MKQETAQRLYKQMKECMEQKEVFLREGFSREDLAREIKSNRTYLTKALHLRSLTFARFVNSYRAQYAIDLLACNEDMSVEELALRSGFGSSRAMNRYIKESAGLGARALQCRIFKDSVKVQP